LFFFLLEIFILGKKNNPFKNWNLKWKS
jgi:hypothetical protein